MPIQAGNFNGRALVLYCTDNLFYSAGLRRESMRSVSIVLMALTISLVPVAGFAAGPVNTVNNGPVINGGAYFNTATGKTTFSNTAGTGLWLKSGSNLRGAEVNASGGLTNNGGTFLLQAPGQTVRLDGNIDVRAIRDGSGQYLGDGGKVFVDAAYLFQKGNIYASGYSGGLVQFNVDSATINSGARIEARGEGSASAHYPPTNLTVPREGTISINSKGPVDIRHNAFLDTSGGGSDINIEGSVVNMEGVLKSTGTAFDGGTIRLVSAGQTNLASTQAAILSATTNGLFTTAESAAINTRLTSLVANHEGDIVVSAADAVNPRGLLSAQTNILAARRNIENGGWISADGLSFPIDSPLLNGGVVSLNAGSTITNTGRLSASGGGVSGDPHQGRAGIMALSYKDGLFNSGSIVATSRSTFGGGLIDFSGPVNPSGNGTVAAFGSDHQHGIGTIVMPNPGVTSNQLYGTWARTRPNEVVYGTNFFQGMIFMNASLPGASITNGSLETWFNHGIVRSNYDQLGTGQARANIGNYYGHTISNNPIIVSSNDGSSFQLESFIAPFTSLTLLTNGSVNVPTPIQIGFNHFHLHTDPFEDDLAESERGRLSVMSNSLTFQPIGGFTISGQTDYMLISEKGRFGPPFNRVFSATDMGPGTAYIALKNAFTGSPANFSMDRFDPSLIIKAP
jgi:hypothetical protein